MLETTLFSPFVLPLLLLFAGAIFVFKSYRGHASVTSITTNGGSSQLESTQQNQIPISSPSSASLPLSKSTQKPRANDALPSSPSGSLAIDFNVRTTVEETVSRFTFSAKEKGIELSCLFSSDSPASLRGEPGELRLILLNLLEYALSSITTGEVLVRGALVEQTSQHATFRFSVSSLPTKPVGALSLAHGNPSSDHPLHSMPPAREPAGLALSKQLVKGWGGEFGFERNPASGTTVWFTVTLEKPPPQVFSDLIPSVNLAGSRILVVSHEFSLSEADIRRWELTSHHLAPSRLVYSTLTAAVQEEKAYHILLLHCQSLDADTLTLIARIRANPALETLRLVLLTNWGRKGDARQVRLAGVDAYLTFPIASPLLFECLAAVLSQPPYPLAPELPLITRYTLAEAQLRGRERILIVDSNLADQKLAVRLVEELGYRADVCVTAREAIEANARLPYAAILLPTQMAGIDGIAAAEQIRQHDQQESRHTLLIAVLQSRSDDKQARCLAAGIDATIRKPLRVENLKAMLEQYRHAAPERSSTVSVITRAKTSNVNPTRA